MTALACRVLLLLVPLLAFRPAAAQQEALDAVVAVRASVPSEARTAQSLGTSRSGSGVVIDDSGLILTIGYLVVEAETIEVEYGERQVLPAELVAYDHESGFGLVRTALPVAVSPLRFGDSDALTEETPVLVASRMNVLAVEAAYVRDRRTFAGSWEYLLDDAIFTAPPFPHFGGAALIDSEGRLVGIGSLIVPDAGPRGRPMPGNMFVPVGALEPILADLLAEGRRSGAEQPWLGVTLAEDRGHVWVQRVAPDGPAAQAGLGAGDLLVGVAGTSTPDLVEFYRRVRALGAAGVEVPLNRLNGSRIEDVIVRSTDRASYLREPSGL
ncbi:S1C family serine protease [Marinivivus vitaminiproducens]|uniref:S1C family serine protease n=1 Tax=Marinivivus vitaminiproducens TaxID=3035935 RepID=UPI00279EC40E|nr:S1C family serine protease [Geminicoccaceae bacterium SCSIO 64248]